MLFVCEPQLKEGKKALSKLKSELDFTEYFLRYKGSSSDLDTQLVFQIELRKAEQQEQETIINLSQEIFNDDYEDAKSMITKTFKADNRNTIYSEIR